MTDIQQDITYVELSCFSWRVQHNPEGAGLMLVVERGIPCEAHSQVLSVHTTNTPSLATVKKVVEREMSTIKDRINAFVDLSKTYGWGEDKFFKEAIAILFKQHLLATIATWAEKEEDLAN